MRNLEEIILNSEAVIIYQGAFRLLKNLKHIKAKSIALMGSEACKGLEKLEEIELSGKSPLIINTGTFQGCKNFNINTILKDGVKEIHNKAFSGNKVCKSIVIPSTVTSLATSAFYGSDIDNVKILSESISLIYLGCNLFEDKSKTNHKVTIELSETALIEPMSLVGSNIEFIRTKVDKSVINKINKSKLIGAKDHSSSVARLSYDIVDALSFIDQSILTRHICDVAVDALRYRTVCKYQFSLNCDIMLEAVKISFPINFPAQFLTAERLKCGDKYLFIKCKKDILIYPIDKYMIQNFYSDKANYSKRINPVVISTKNLKSLDVADDGEIRAVYKTNNGYQQNAYNAYKMHS